MFFSFDCSKTPLAPCFQDPLGHAIYEIITLYEKCALQRKHVLFFRYYSQIYVCKKKTNIIQYIRFQFRFPWEAKKKSQTS